MFGYSEILKSRQFTHFDYEDWKKLLDPEIQIELKKITKKYNTNNK